MSKTKTFRARLKLSMPITESRKLSGREFQTLGPAAERQLLEDTKYMQVISTDLCVRHCVVTYW